MGPGELGNRAMRAVERGERRTERERGKEEERKRSARNTWEQREKEGEKRQRESAGM